MKNRDNEVIAVRATGILSTYIIVIVMGIILMIVGVEEYFRLGDSNLWLVFSSGITVIILGIWLLIRYLIVPKVLIVREKNNLLILEKKIPICEIEEINYSCAYRDKLFPGFSSWGKLLLTVGDLKIRLRYVEEVAHVCKRIKILINEEKMNKHN